jgi:hypothetical protein
VWATIPFQGYEEQSASLGYGQYLTYYAQGRTQLRKPIIIIDGFDPLEERNCEAIYRVRLKYQDSQTTQSFLGDEFRYPTPSAGYDVIILNAPKYEYTIYQRTTCDPRSNRCFTQDVKGYRVGGADYIERNAFVLVELIKRVNQQLQANGSNEKITVIGPSMGGLVSRYALRYMEQNGMNANCKLWVSFDSPHHGATVPLGLQFFLNLTEGISAGSKAALRDQLNVPAARQMLIQHYKGRNGEYVSGAPGFRDRFVQTMNSMGFPQAACMRKVALNNGSKAGIFQVGGACTDAMRVKAEFGPGAAPVSCAPIGISTGLFWISKKLCGIPVLETHAYTSPNNNDLCKIASREILGINGNKGEVFIRGNGQPSLDLLPGGNKNFLGNIAEQAKFYNWFFKTSADIFLPTGTFIPSVSSYALKNTNRNWGDALNGIDIQSDTPFDALYAPDYNEEHTQVTKAGVDFIKAQLALADQQCSAQSLPFSNGCYTIKAKHSNKYLQPENNNGGARIRQYGQNGQSNQIFQLESVDGNSYKIISQSSSKVWEASGSGTSNGTAVNQGDWVSGNNQKWYINPWGDGSYKLEAKHVSGKLADIEGVYTNDGAGVHLWDSHGGDNQRYFFTSTSCSVNPPNPPVSFSQCVESESSNGNGPVTDDFNASGGYTRGAENNNNHYVDYNINGVPSSGTYSVTLRYYSSSAPTISVQVSGGSSQTVSLANSGSWNIAWTTQTFSVNLNQGANTIRIQGTGGGSCRQDKICVSGGGNSCTPPSAPSVAANPGSINSGGTSQLSATCSNGASLSWSHGLSGSSFVVMPSTTTTYTATCTSNGCSSSTNVTIAVSNPGGNCFELRMASNQKRITNLNGVIKVKDPNNTNSQIWRLEESGGYLKLIAQDGTGRVMGVENGGQSSGDLITLQNYNGGDHQLWTQQLVNDNNPGLKYGFVRKNAAMILRSEPFFGEGDPDPTLTDIKLTTIADLEVYGRNKFFIDPKTCPNLRIGLEGKAIESQLEKLIVAPNPNSGEFDVTFYLETEKSATLTVSDVQGNTWYQRVIKGQGINKEKVKLSGHSSGTFLVLLRKEGGVEVKKIIVIH